MNSFKPTNQAFSVLRAAFGISIILGTTAVIGQIHASHLQNRFFQQHQIKISEEIKQKLDIIQWQLRGSSKLPEDTQEK